MKVREDLRQRYFTDVKFHHTVNAMAQLMAVYAFTPNEMKDVLEVAKSKYYLDLAADSENLCNHGVRVSPELGCATCENST